MKQLGCCSLLLSTFVPVSASQFISQKNITFDEIKIYNNEFFFVNFCLFCPFGERSAL